MKKRDIIVKVDMMAAWAVILVLFVVYVTCSARLFHQYSNLPEFAPEQLARRFYEVLNNQHLVMVGDSLMRYQYVSLVHLLRYGTFPELLLDHGNLLWQSNFPSFMNFFRNITAALAPNEFCDCHREVYAGSFAPVYENRYYRDEKRNFSVSYIMYFGDKNDIHGHFRTNGATGELVEEEWRFSEVYTFLEHINEILSPPPSFLLLNAGFHPNHYNDTTHRDRVARAAKQAAPRAIWKTANCPQQRLLKWPTNSFDIPMCAYAGLECVSLEWTCYLNEAEMVDPFHFQPPVYGDINIQLLEQLLHPGKTLRYKPLTVPNTVVTVPDREPPASYLVDEHGRLRPLLPTPQPPTVTTECEGIPPDWAKYNRTVRELLRHIVGEPVTVPCEGTLIRFSNSRSIYLVQAGKLREFQSWGAFVKMGFDLDQVKVVTASNVFPLPLGEPIY